MPGSFPAETAAPLKARVKLGDLRHERADAFGEVAATGCFDLLESRFAIISKRIELFPDFIGAK
jgi:hypothetical protein